MEKAKYIIEYDPAIYEKLKKLPSSVREIIKIAIEKKLTVDPIACGKPLRYSLKGFRRLRVGDYRVIYQIIEEKVLVFIVEIDHRKDVYS